MPALGGRSTHPGRGSKPTRAEAKPVAYEATAYGPPWGGINGPGEATACGVQLNGGSPEVNAVAGPPSLACGEIVEVKPNPGGNDWAPFVVWDRGGAITEGHLDFYLTSRAQQTRWGRKSVEVRKTGKSIDFPDDPEDINDYIGRRMKQPVAGVGAGDGSPASNPLGFVGDIAGAIGAIAGVVEGIARFFIGLGELLLTPEGWARVGKILFGAALLWVGGNRLMEATYGISPRSATRGLYVGAARRIGARGAVYGGIGGG